MKVATHNGMTITFNPAWHSYSCNGSKLTSVSKHMQQFKQPFDPDGIITARCAIKEGIPVEELKAKWRLKGQNSMELGSAVHGYMESLWAGKTCQMPYPEYTDTCRDLHEYLNNRYEFIEAEKIIFSKDLQLAGTTDLILKHDNYYVIIDYKTGDFYKPAYGNLLEPYQLYAASNLNIYSMQLAFYKKIMAYENYFDGDIRTGLIHIRPDGFEPIQTIFATV